MESHHRRHHVFYQPPEGGVRVPLIPGEVGRNGVYNQQAQVTVNGAETLQISSGLCERENVDIVQAVGESIQQLASLDKVQQPLRLGWGCPAA